MKVFWLRDEKKTPVACVATEKISEYQGVPDIAFAVSTWNPRDKFNKALGRKIAEDRLTKSIANDPYLLGHSDKVTIVTTITQERELPQRTRDAAQLWLNSRG